jgi:hypothetical protein
MAGDETEEGAASAPELLAQSRSPLVRRASGAGR